jgi:hypothetical protein
MPHSAQVKPSWYGESVGHYAENNVGQLIGKVFSILIANVPDF